MAALFFQLVGSKSWQESLIPIFPYTPRLIRYVQKQRPI